MAIRFTADNIRNVIAKVKADKSPGKDEIPVEFIKYAPETTREQITEYTTP